MEFFGYKIEKINKSEEEALQQAKEVLNKHGFRAVRVTRDKSNKQKAMKKANDERVKQTRAKIQNGVNLLRMEGKKITSYSLAKYAEVSTNTAKKYIELLNIKN